MLSEPADPLQQHSATSSGGQAPHTDQPEQRSFFSRAWRQIKLFGKRGIRIVSLVSGLAVAVVSITALYHAIFDRAVAIQPLAVPKYLADRGFTADVAATRFRDAINSLIAQSTTSMKAHNILDHVDRSDVVIPTVGLSISTIAAEIGSFFHIKRGQVMSGEFVDIDDHLYLRVRLDGQQISPAIEGDKQHPDILLVKAARTFIDKTQPYILATITYENDPTDALNIIERIIVHYDEKEEQVKYAYALRCLIYRRLGRADEAASECDNALKIDRNFTVALIDRSLLYEDRREFDQALRLYTRALEIDPSLATPHNNMGYVLGVLGKKREAIEEYKTAIRLNPNFSTAHCNYGFALTGEDNKAAIAEFKKTIYIDPKYKRGHLGLALALERDGQVDDAIREYGRLLDIDPTNSEATEMLDKLLESQRLPTPEARSQPMPEAKSEMPVAAQASATTAPAQDRRAMRNRSESQAR